MNTFGKALLLGALISIAADIKGQVPVDVTHYITNAGFDEDLTFNADGTTKEIVDKNTSLSNRSWAYITEDNTTYAWAKTSTEGNTYWKETDGRTHAINGFVGQIKGWTTTNANSYDCEWVFFGSLPYNLTETAIPLTDNGSTYQEIPQKPENSNGEDNIGALFMRAGWGGKCSYKQVVSLPCAKYRLEYWSININSASTIQATDVTNVTCRNEVFKDESGAGLSATTWTKHEFEFIPYSEFTLEFGYQSGASGSNTNPHVFIDGVRLYKIADVDYDEILQTELQELADSLQALADDYRIAEYSSICTEIYEVIDNAFNASNQEEIENAIENQKNYIQKINSLLPIFETFTSLRYEAENILSSSQPKPGIETFKATYDDINAELETATTDNIASLSQKLSVAINEYKMSDAISNTAFECTFMIQTPHFIKKEFEPVYNGAGLPTYPNASQYINGTAPADASSVGWYKGEKTSGDQRLNYAQSRVCWNLWDTSAGLHTINQDITDLPVGYYTVTADMITQPEYIHEAHVYAKTSTDDVSSPYLTVGNWNSTRDGEWTTLTTPKIKVTDGNLTIGGRSVFPENNQKGWFCITNVRLHYHSNVVEMEGIEIPETDITLIIGESRKLEVSVIPTNTSFKKLVWESDNDDVVTIDDDGNMFARKEGTANITVRSFMDGNINATCNIVVERDETTYSSLIINEIQSANIDMFVDPSFNYGGWIELYNPTDKTAGLYGLYVSDDINNLKKFRLTADAGTIPPKGFGNIWFDHNEDKTSQVDFKLDYDGGTIYLSDYDGNLITSQTYTTAVPRTSYARTTDGAASWGITAEPTPGKSNATSTFAVGRLEAPVVDKDAQLFTTPFTVSVNIPSGTTLRYTTDGSTPTLANGATSETGLFNVSATTTYRFRLFKDGTLPSEVVTRSYIYLNRDITLPVISVVTDPINLYDDSLGILVKGVNGKPGLGQDTPCNWNMNWDRPVNFEFISTDGSMAISQEVDMAICGGWSRAWSPHSFKLKAEKIYEGRSSLDHTFFADKPYIKHKTLQMRNGGNDTGSRIKDPVLQEIVRTSGLDIDCQSYVPVVHFINGQYKGMLNMREPNNKHFAYANYGYSSDEIDQFEIDPYTNYKQMTGTEDSFLEWYELAFNASDPAVYEQICQMIDIDEYTNYMAVQLYLGGTDWPQNNVKGFKPRYDDGKFRFVLFDLDFAFGTSTPLNTFEGKNTYEFDYPDETGNLWQEIKFVTIFLNMLSNDTFRKKFIDTFCIVGGSVFTPQRSTEIIRQLSDRVLSTLQQEGQNPYNTANDVIANIENRLPAMISHLKNYGRMQLANTTEQKVKISSTTPQARISANGINLPTNSFDGYMFSPVTLKANTPAGHIFTGWKNSALSVTDENTIFANGDNWHYYDQGSLDHTDWTSRSYDTSTWRSGNAPLGYYTGDNNNIRGYNTILDYGTNPSNKRPAYYIRKTITLETRPAETATFRFDYTVDDGFIIYVNGTEAGRYLMPAGNTSYNTYASAHASGNPDTGTILIDASLFTSGENVIAVEIHNNSATSSDIYFDASLTLQTCTYKEQYVCTDEEYTLPHTGDFQLVACFEKKSGDEAQASPLTPVKINEVCASNSVYINEYIEKNDWIELYNTTDTPIDVAGMYISDNLKKPHKYQIPSIEGINSVIAPYGHLILWADKLAPINQLHTSFKLGAEGGEVLLTAQDATWCDTLVYPAHNSDHSVGLYPDGGPDVYVMERQTIGESNAINTYSSFYEEPNIPNIINDVEIERNGGLSLAYNQDGNIHIRCENSAAVHLNVYTASGQNCINTTIHLSGKIGRISLSSLPEGTYIVRAADEEDNRCAVKVYKR